MKNISFDLVHVTESAALAASYWVGSGNKLEADKAATAAMQERLGKINDFCGYVKIGEGRKDNSYGLYKGDVIFGVGNHKEFDLACDPIDGTRPTVNSGPEAISVIAVSNKNTMFDTDEYYMLKLAVSGKIAHKVRLNLNAELSVLCQQVACALDKPLHRLMVCILNRPRHQKYVDEMRSLGVRIKLIEDCDISGAIATCLPDSEIDMQFGVGGAPEAVITAAAIKCLGGCFMSQIWKDGQVLGDVFEIEDLVKGECVFSATGITNGSLLRGVRFDSRGPVTNSVFMRSESRTIRWLTTNHGN